MTQPFTSDDSLPNTQSISGQGKRTEDSAERASKLPDSVQPAIVHPNFDPMQTPLDPARSLTDIPEPARRMNGQLRRLYGKSIRFYQPKEESLSKWQLMTSEPFAEYLALLGAARLVALPDSFYRHYHSPSSQPLLSSLEDMTLLDLLDIQRIMNQYPQLTRYGFSADNSLNGDDSYNNSSKNSTSNIPNNKPVTLRAVTKNYNPDELLNSLYADDWQVVLQPEQFETGMGSLATDIMACSVAVHALTQSATRKSINHSYSAAQICQHVRSYLLSQVCRLPAHRYQYRQIRLFTGHIIIAAAYLGWNIQVQDDGQCYFNLSSRCGLLTRYANMQDYDINGWSS
ncbi:hypothetical protein [Psychrobacter urativorans]|uniref:hypothetical protein n=1 Tax=Psychrobacter urativorans TaxID=45610 RepID=UPI00191B12F9|nr:hypothetical protein [Psychrobacter urativorans]